MEVEVAGLGEPRVVQRLEEGVQHYLTYFEERILADPGSWIHLLDRKWRRVLAAAASRAAASSSSFSPAVT